MINVHSDRKRRKFKKYIKAYIKTYTKELIEDEQIMRTSKNGLTLMIAAEDCIRLEDLLDALRVLEQEFDD